MYQNIKIPVIIGNNSFDAIILSLGFILIFILIILSLMLELQ